MRKKLKLQRGDAVVLILPNIPEFFICALAVMLAGLKLTTINPTYTTGKLIITNNLWTALYSIYMGLTIMYWLWDR